MKVEKIETLRVTIDKMFYCDVTPSADYEGYHDFTLHRVNTGESVFMFGLEIKSEEYAAELVMANYMDYVEDLMFNDYRESVIDEN